MNEASNKDLLYTILKKCPSSFELTDICRDLNVNENELSGENLAEKGQSLFRKMDYEDRLSDLESVFRKRYPNRFNKKRQVNNLAPPTPVRPNYLKLFMSGVSTSSLRLFRFAFKLRQPGKRRIFYIALYAMIFIFIFGLFQFFYKSPAKIPQAPAGLNELPPDPNDKTGICITIHCAFYFGGVNAVYKLDAVAAANRNDEADASAYLQWAIDTDITDAEAKILLTNTNILAAKKPYIIAAVTATLTCIDAQPTPEDRLEINAGLDTLQGAYIAQKIYNKAHPDRQLLLEIVNLGSASATQESTSQQRLAQFLIGEARKYPESFLGVVGLPFGPFDTFVGILSSASIPMISLAPQMDSDATNYLVSIVPSLTEITDDIASSIKALSHTVYVVYNGDTLYGSQMSTIFSEAFTSLDGFTANSSAYSETNMQSDLASVAHQINIEEMNANSNDPVVFIGSPEDAAQFYSQLQNKTIPMFGDDSFFDYVHLPVSVKKQLDGITFFAFAYEDQWQEEKFSSEPVIDSYYVKEYDPGNKRRGSYSFERASDTVLLAYDSLSLLASAGDEANPLPGCQKSDDHCTFTDQKCMLNSTAKPSSVTKSLREQQWEFIHECTFVGASGEISLNMPNSSPVNKEFLILRIQWDQAKYGEVTHTISKFGQFAQ